MIDRNKPDYQTPTQKEIWNAATNLVPLEISLPAIPMEYHQSCRDLYHFFTDILEDMYIHPDPYMALGDVQTYIRWFWVFLYKAYDFEGGAFITPIDKHKKFVKKMGAPLLDFLTTRWGLQIKKTDTEVRISNTKYPHMLSAVYNTLQAAYKNYNVNCGDYLTFCDFRALVNYKRTYHDMLELLNREGQAIAESICEFALARGIKPVKCTYFNRVEFKKKGKIVFILDVAEGKNLKINIGFAELGGQAFRRMSDAIDAYTDKEIFVRYLRNHLKKCTNCTPGCQKRANPVEIFGLKTIFCQPFLRMFQPPKTDLHHIFRLIELREMVVDAGISEIFYPGNG
ncbi:MAG: hypothetical protein IJW40_10565 [Clostridia bacterium]|nr:hypothetical protein [Clostridia bacterium]